MQKVCQKELRTLALNLKALRMKPMMIRKIFLGALLLAGCQKQPVDEVDLDQMVLLEEEMDQKALAGEPLESPQEVLIKEPENAQY